MSPLRRLRRSAINLSTASCGTRLSATRPVRRYSSVSFLSGCFCVFTGPAGGELGGGVGFLVSAVGGGGGFAGMIFRGVGLHYKTGGLYVQNPAGSVNSGSKTLLNFLLSPVNLKL